MNKQELINKLVIKDNFHKYVEVCLLEGLSIERQDCFPEINIYYYDDKYIKKETGETKDACHWIKINPASKLPYNTEFEVDGKMLSGPNNFFKYYDKITKFIVSNDNDFQSPLTTQIINVKPSLTTGKQWSRSYDSVPGHFEISYVCHSLHEPALFQMVSGEVVGEKYYVDGDRLHPKDFLKESREHKLSRVLGIDLKAERLELERKEMLEEKELEKEKILEDRLKEMENATYSTITYYRDDSEENPYHLLA